MMFLAEMSGNIAVGLAATGGAIGVGLAALGAAGAIGRNPGSFGLVFTTALLGMALSEGLAILVFFVVGR
ncbi:MAG: ATPase [Candidatus Methylacidiphilaceae bacterium]|jgi:F-type H+-transporting ATPase subunit c|uniref:ATP synthase F(0) sector subunit c n=2 Tax=Methylacidimicrobium TaxID=1541670 RepID=A0A5E6MFV3_9BACT|nr:MULTISPECIES: ATPase [Methylacidimicrobium]MDD4933087.1 ATPase [Candidatus Methylacidiphilaceae bacterium]QSR85826.1 ATPase [Methylacidimicrobium sp. B4]VVM07981.1 F-type H+-transporting ATPase subunit c [Methylacidimicrobium tartarophylax]